MDIKQVQNLIKFVAKSGVSEVKIEDKDFKLTIKNKAEIVTPPSVAPVASVAAPVAIQATAPVAAVPATSVTQESAQEMSPADELDESKYISI